MIDIPSFQILGRQSIEVTRHPYLDHQKQILDRLYQRLENEIFVCTLQQVSSSHQLKDLHQLDYEHRRGIKLLIFLVLLEDL